MEIIQRILEAYFEYVRFILEHIFWFIPKEERLHFNAELKKNSKVIIRAVAAIMTFFFLFVFRAEISFSGCPRPRASS